MAIRAAQVKKILDNMPGDWLGTTFPNDDRFIGRQKFVRLIYGMLTNDVPVTTEELSRMHPEDYVRLGSAPATMLEVIRAVQRGYPVEHVYSFGSSTLGLISVLLTAPGKVHVYGRNDPHHKEHEALLRKFFAAELRHMEGDEIPRFDDGTTVLFTDACRSEVSPNVDAVVDSNGFLYLTKPERFVTADVMKDGKMVHESIHTMRKRLGGCLPTPDVLALLKGEPLETEPDTAELRQALKVFGGVGDCPGKTVLATTGLAAICSLVMAGVVVGDFNVDLLMCSTSYGGSSQQADILVKKVANKFDKHTFDIQGGRPVFRAMAGKLEEMKKGPRKNLTLIQLEYPTNPDMKDCNLTDLQRVVLDYQKVTGSQVVVMFDTTFSPISKVGAEFKDIAVVVFNSLSKSVSGGFTTGGSLVANGHKAAQELLDTAHTYLALLDNEAKPCQKHILNKMHGECETRVRAAHRNAVECAKSLEETVLKHSGKEMKVNFVTSAQIVKNVIPATFSFNLPVPDGATPEEVEGLAQKIVDGLVAAHPKGIKPCVSFGQKNNLVYATVPATSTQGVLSAEAKAKQAIGGVQLVRFSFPPEMDMDAWNAAIETAISALYKAKKVDDSGAVETKSQDKAVAPAKSTSASGGGSGSGSGGAGAAGDSGSSAPAASKCGCKWLGLGVGITALAVLGAVLYARKRR